MPVLGPGDSATALSIMRSLLGDERIVIAPAGSRARHRATTLPKWLLGAALFALGPWTEVNVGWWGLLGGLARAGVQVLSVLALARVVRGFAAAVKARVEGVIAPSRQQPLRSRTLGVALQLGSVALFALCCVLMYRSSRAMGFARQPASMMDSFAMPVVWAGALLSVLLLGVGYRLSLPSAAPLVKNDQPVILFLRGFVDDARYDYNFRGWRAWFLGLSSLRQHRWLSTFGPFYGLIPLRLLRSLTRKAADTAEEQLTLALRRHGQLVAIGRPGEWLPQPGAARLYLEDGAWQEAITGLLSRARWVLVQPGESEGVWWEIRELFREVPRHRIIISVNHYREQPPRWPLFRERLEQEVGLRLPEDIGDALFVGFEEGDPPRLLRPAYRSVLSAAFHGCEVDLAATLAPIMGGARSGRLRRPATLSVLATGMLIHVASFLFMITALVYGVFAAEQLSIAHRASQPAPGPTSPQAKRVKTYQYTRGLTLQLPDFWRDRGQPAGHPAFTLGDILYTKLALLRTPETSRASTSETVAASPCLHGRTWATLDFWQSGAMAIVGIEAGPGYRTRVHSLCTGPHAVVVAASFASELADILAPSMRRVLDGVEWAPRER